MNESIINWSELIWWEVGNAHYKLLPAGYKIWGFTKLYHNDNIDLKETECDSMDLSQDEVQWSALMNIVTIVLIT